MFITQKPTWIRAKLCCVVLSAGLLSSYSYAANTSQPQGLSWLLEQLQHHPQMIAAKAQLDAQLGFSLANRQALYNPELNSALEREGSNTNVSIGISQTLDWWDKKSNRESQSQFMQQVAQSQYQLSYQQQLAALLSTMVNWQASFANYQLARQQEQQLNQLIDLVKRGQETGDLGQIDVELSVLSLSASLAETTSAIADYKKAQSQLNQLLPNWTIDAGLIRQALAQLQQLQQSPELARFLKPNLSKRDLAALLSSQPQIQLAKARWQQQQQQALVASKSTKSDPTVGVNIGRNGDDSVVGVSLSMPLNLRNNYQAYSQAENQQSLALDAAYQALYQRQGFELSASQEVLNALSLQLKRWQNLMGQHSDSSKKLLQQQWRSGDLGTTQYLQALAQRREGLAAGISLQRSYRLAQVDWLNQSGLLNRLSQFNAPKPVN